MTVHEDNRRTFLKAAGVTGAAVLAAGCLGDDNGDDGDDGDDGNGEDDGPDGYEIDPGTAIELDGQTPGWVGIAPGEIEGEENPTLILQEGEEYEIGWTEGDGSPHNIAIWDDDGDVVDDLATPEVSDPGDDQWLEFTASDEMAEYVCEPHETTMIADIVVE
ncbi:twin-arginine translocation signal domain-containing protein [Halobiforma nitratireducens]|uniref:Blue (Type 1) copper domain-containing protein n=1 Tax=Halobiforma nitratireducens JCM 10879 TaxID=1227454 RepID=M0MJ88_9EURY|nr:twin-arginine translocation signal domain-containing protein [Halobiforma nitratireducens]EMA45741.1 blue (type 1) copper domain-containing protein [Halobiforma nitratireducens JCM 10879]